MPPKPRERSPGGGRYTSFIRDCLCRLSGHTPDMSPPRHRERVEDMPRARYATLAARMIFYMLMFAPPPLTPRTIQTDRIVRPSRNEEYGGQQSASAVTTGSRRHEWQPPPAWQWDGKRQTPGNRRGTAAGVGVGIGMFTITIPLRIAQTTRRHPCRQTHISSSRTRTNNQLISVLHER